jgi:hypothetical protein
MQSLCGALAAAAFLSLAIGVRRCTSTPFKRQRSEMAATGRSRIGDVRGVVGPEPFGPWRRCRPSAVAGFPLGYLCVKEGAQDLIQVW